MSGIDLQSSVAQIVLKQPVLSRVFEQLGIDYCCGGNKTLEQACGDKGLEAKAIVERLNAAGSAREAEGPVLDLAAMPLDELAQHIEETHHTFLRDELPRLDALTKKVAEVHGDREPRMIEVRSVFVALVEELAPHMMKEEQILFPMIRDLVQADKTPQFHCGTLANPIGQMRIEHDNAGSALEKLSELTDGFVAPEWGCNTCRAMADGLQGLALDLHQHIHKENNVLFPRAIEMEKQKQ